jgi:DNA-binding NtrC family response regulator
VAQDQPCSDFVVLVVEDEPDLRDVLVRLIRDVLGYRVLSAWCATHALEVIDSGVHVDLVFSDVVMPGESGLTLAKEVHRRVADLPVVLATGYPDVVDRVLSAGALALMKPVSLDRLEAVLTEQLHSRHRNTTPGQLSL